MSEEKKKKVIHVDKLIIHAKEVEVNQEKPSHKPPHREEVQREENHGKEQETDRNRDPWGFFFGGRRQAERELESSEHEEG
ncbi:hypothetical protein [Cytobacillus purgationiresistens]|uniref:Uncharacterized protein n=1 Tax=Cytobacillus purgationiresistens TaxID=863449 RepID=A0ABU0AP65_9BACI|nr:hypothetical protein [Cytobacillus purgationiresistens]MDQ0272659.1 hypothetical protein [Cytobacillus purgationiresistens]